MQLLRNYRIIETRNNLCVMEQPHPIPYDSCGIALRSAGLPSVDLVRLAAGKRRWEHAVLACHELWHGEEGDSKCHLARHEWDIENGWPNLLARSIEWDPTRPVALAHTTTDRMLINAIFANPLPLVELDLSLTEVTGECLPHLASLTQLAILNLLERRTRRRDRRHVLNSISQLKVLKLIIDCGVFCDVEELVATLPGVTIQQEHDDFGSFARAMRRWVRLVVREAMHWRPANHYAPHLCLRK